MQGQRDWPRSCEGFRDLLRYWVRMQFISQLISKWFIHVKCGRRRGISCAGLAAAPTWCFILSWQMDSRRGLKERTYVRCPAWWVESVRRKKEGEKRKQKAEELASLALAHSKMRFVGEPTLTQSCRPTSGRLTSPNLSSTLEQTKPNLQHHGQTSRRQRSS